MASSGLSSGSDWYKPGDHDPNLDPVKNAFKKGVLKFYTVLTKDSRKIALVNQADEIQDIQKIVVGLQTKYESRRASGKTHKWITKFSKRVAIYGDILDVLVQHHPEYVALVWGAMKFLFVAIENHEALLTRMSKGLVQIADSLPQLERVIILYPTEEMKSCLADTYANVIRFLIRVHDWFETTTFTRAVQSITRPTELRYDDLLEEIQISTHRIETLAVTAAQAELRDTHIIVIATRAEQQETQAQMREMHMTIKGMEQLMIANHQITSAAQLNTNRALTDLQFSQILTFLSNLPLEDPDKSLQHARYMRNRNRQRSMASDPFWLTSKFQTWNSAACSSMVMIRGTFSNQTTVKDFLTDAIVCIRASNVPVVWAIKTLGSTDSRMTLVDLLRYLTCQILKLQRMPTESAMSLECAKFQSARGEHEWFNLLAASLANLKHVYIIMDLELLSQKLENVSDNFELSAAFWGLFGELGRRSPNTVVKVMLVSYGSNVFNTFDERSKGNLILVNRKGPQKHSKLWNVKSKRVINIKSREIN